MPSEYDRYSDGPHCGDSRTPRALWCSAMNGCVFCARTGGAFEHISESSHKERHATKTAPVIPVKLAVLARFARSGHAPSLELVRAAVRAALETHAGNRDQSARMLKVSQRVLHYWLLPLSDPRGLGLDDLAREYPRVRGRPRNKAAPAAAVKDAVKSAKAARDPARTPAKAPRAARPRIAVGSNGR